MKLSEFYLNAGTWGEESHPYLYTIAEAMCPDMKFAIVGVDPEHTSNEALIRAMRPVPGAGR